MFISPAYAQAAAPGGGDIISMFLPLILIMAVFWFLLIRPQQKKMKEHQAMLANIRRGDTVVTSGGLIGKVAKVADDELTVELGEGMRVKVKRSYIAEVRVKGQPANDNPGKK
jgi:preprotein translocase subunit YajC